MRKELSLHFYARLAGFLYLFIIAIFDAADYFILTPAIVPGNFAASAQNVMASETLYRFGLACQFAASWLTIGLAGSLYVVVRAVDPSVAMFALAFRIVEAALGSICTLSSFVALRLYTGASTAFGEDQSQVLVQLLGRFYGACFQMTVIFFSVGSILFFYLFLKSRLIPRLISGFGIFASILVTLLGFSNLVVPRYSEALSPGWIAILVAEVAAGLWLLIKGVDLSFWKTREALS
ncbi:MAG: DUF4386 domain-containing protein [Alphaproteobacteria bacterium]|nr:DUF4386 domain-containing protein [Alphaproteobacteria bacterium]